MLYILFDNLAAKFIISGDASLVVVNYRGTNLVYVGSSSWKIGDITGERRVHRITLSGSEMFGCFFVSSLKRSGVQDASHLEGSGGRAWPYGPRARAGDDSRPLRYLQPCALRTRARH